MITSQVTNNVTNANNNSPDQQQSATESLGKDDFLKLLAAELRNQDPMQSTDDKEFISEMAQFSSLEQMTNISQGIGSMQQELAALSSQFMLAQGASLIGKNVSGNDANGQQIQGVVTGVKWNDANLELQIGDSTLDLSNVVSIAS